MKIKIGYKKKNGETAGTILRIDDEGFLWVLEPGRNRLKKGAQLVFWLDDFKSGSLVFLGVDEDE